MGLLLSRVDAVLVHSADQARLAHDLGARRVSVADLPPHVPGGHPISRGPRPGPTRLLALGLIREHKGIDVLLRAMRTVPEVTLTIAGEMSGPARRVVGGLASDPLLAGRVEIREGYVPADALAALLADHDVLALPYRSATASQNVVLGHAHGLPVLASDVAPFSQQVTDGVNGLLVPPDDERALAGALRRLGDPEVRRRLADGVQTPDLSGPWAHYLGTIEALSLDESLLGPGPEPIDVRGAPTSPTRRTSATTPPSRASTTPRGMPSCRVRLRRRPPRGQGPPASAGGSHPERRRRAGGHDHRSHLGHAGRRDAAPGAPDALVAARRPRPASGGRARLGARDRRAR